MKRALIGLCLLFVAAIPVTFAGQPGQANMFTVDCTRGQTISAALAQGDDRRPLVVNVRGTCNEFVSIGRDNVTLHGDPAATINAPNSDSDLIYVGGNGVTLENLTLTGGYMGVRFEGTYRSIVSNCVIQDTRIDGIRVFVGDVRVINSTIQHAGASGVYLIRGGSAGVSNSQILDNSGAGIYATGHATVTAIGSMITGNGSHGVQLENSSEGSFTNNTIAGNGIGSSKGGTGISVAQSQASVGGGNVIRDNRGDGVLVLAGATANVDGNTITNNTANGIFGYLGTTLVLNGNVLSRNGGAGVACRANCTLQIAGATIQNNASDGIVVMLGSKFILLAPTTSSTGNGGWGLWCGDNESSVDGLGQFNGSVSDSCTDFNK